jgi:hypothetical protein
MSLTRGIAWCPCWTAEITCLDTTGYFSKFQIEGKFLHHVNQVQSKAVATYAASLRARFKPPETVNVPPNPRMSTPTRNAWNQSPSLKLTHDNFPNLEGNVTPSCHHTDKKQCTETSSQSFNANADDSSLSPPSVGTTQTELMDKHTKFQAALLTIQTSFADKLHQVQSHQ